MNIFSFYPMLQSLDDDGLTFAEVLAGIPHDPASIVVYLLVFGSVGLVIWSGRKRGNPPARS